MRQSPNRVWIAGATLALAAFPYQAHAADVEAVTPSRIDPNVRQFDDPNVVIARGATDKDAPLAIFLPGTGGRSTRRIRMRGGTAI